MLLSAQVCPNVGLGVSSGVFQQEREFLPSLGMLEWPKGVRPEVTHQRTISMCALLQALAKTIHLTSPSFTDEVHYRKSGEIR